VFFIFRYLFGVVIFQDIPDDPLQIFSVFQPGKSHCFHKCMHEKHLLFLYFFGISFSFPPMYIRSGSGIFTVPSAFRLFSRNAISIRGGATTVLFSVCARYLPFSPLTRIFSLLACASPRLEQLPTSKYFF